MNQKIGNKIPGGLVTKTAPPGYEMVRVGGSQGMPPGFVNANHLGQLGQLAAASGPYFPPGLVQSLVGFNPAAVFPPSKFKVLLIHKILQCICVYSMCAIRRVRSYL